MNHGQKNKHPAKEDKQRNQESENMYSKCRANSFLEWKIIVDRDAEDYLLQSVLNKTRWKGPETKAQEPGIDKGGYQEIHHKTKFTRYTEIGETSNTSNMEKGPTAMEREEDQENKKRMESRWEALQKKLTRKAIVDMVEQGYITKEEGESEMKKLERRLCAKGKPPKRQNTGKTQKKCDNHAPTTDRNLSLIHI